MTCEDSTFRCENQKQCVKMSYVCDGDQDCDDYSDEKNCGCSKKNDFKCRGIIEKCINVSLKNSNVQGNFFSTIE